MGLKVRIMSFLVNFFFFTTAFYKTDQLKKLNVSAKFFMPKSDTCCHFGAVFWGLIHHLHSQ